MSQTTPPPDAEPAPSNEPSHPINKPAIASVMVGLLSMALICLIWPLAPVFGIIAVGLGIIGYRLYRRRPEIGGQGSAIAGTGLGLCATLLVAWMLWTYNTTPEAFQPEPEPAPPAPQAEPGPELMPEP